MMVLKDSNNPISKFTIGWLQLTSGNLPMSIGYYKTYPAQLTIRQNVALKEAA